LRSFEDDWLKAAQATGIDAKAALAALKASIAAHK
jgi:hypothetical protein